MNILVIYKFENKKNIIDDTKNNELFYLKREKINFFYLKKFIDKNKINIILSYENDIFLKIYCYFFNIPFLKYRGTENDLEKELQRRIVYHYKKDIPVLMYHRVINKVEDNGVYDTSVTLENFEKQIKYLYDNNYITLTFEDLKNGEYKKRFEKDKKYVIITFDDGYKDNFENVLPILKKYKTKIILFLITHESYNRWDVDISNREKEKRFELMSENELKEFISSGLVEIGGHTSSHLDMPKVDSISLKYDLNKANKKIEELTGKKVISFAYPWGNSNEKVREIVKESGYKFAVSTEKGSPCFSDDLYEIVRVGIYLDDNMEKFKLKLSGYYPFMREKREKRKKFRNKLRRIFGIKMK